MTACCSAARPSLTRAPDAGRRPWILGLAVLSLGACLEGPFEHANPYDAEMEIALTIVGGADTVRSIGSPVLFQLATEPATSGVHVDWSSSAPFLLVSQGEGQFAAAALPATPSTVNVTARLGAHTASRAVVLMPTP